MAGDRFGVGNGQLDHQRTMSLLIGLSMPRFLNGNEGADGILPAFWPRSFHFFM